MPIVESTTYFSPITAYLPIVIATFIGLIIGYFIYRTIKKKNS